MGISTWLVQGNAFLLGEVIDNFYAALLTFCFSIFTSFSAKCFFLVIAKGQAVSFLAANVDILA